MLVLPDAPVTSTTTTLPELGFRSRDGVTEIRGGGGGGGGEDVHLCVGAVGAGFVQGTEAYAPLWFGGAGGAGGVGWGEGWFCGGGGGVGCPDDA